MGKKWRISFQERQEVPPLCLETVSRGSQCKGAGRNLGAEQSGLRGQKAGSLSRIA
jgi:hypothetical protein